MAEKVMILRENRPLFRSSRENSSHIYSPFPAVRGPSERFPSSSVLPPSPLFAARCSLGGDHGIYGEWGGRAGMKISISLPGSMAIFAAHCIRLWDVCRPPHYPLSDGLKVDKESASSLTPLISETAFT